MADNYGLDSPTRKPGKKGSLRDLSHKENTMPSGQGAPTPKEKDMQVQENFGASDSDIKKGYSQGEKAPDDAEYYSNMMSDMYPGGEGNFKGGFLGRDRNHER